MQTVDHYIRLFIELRATVGQAIEISLEQVAAVLCCTPRNGKLILKKMQDLHRIAWVSGRGRGNRSVLTLRVEPSDLLFGLAKELVQKGDVRGATSLVANYGESLPELADHFQLWLKSHFGFHVEAQGQRQVDTLRLRYSKPLLALDPAHVVLRSECHMVKQMFDSLVRYNIHSQVVESHLAYFWESSADGTEWTFYLRKGVMFHHGRSLTAQDVVWTLQRLQSPDVNSPFRWMVENVVEATALDDFTVQIRLRETDHFFLQILSHEHLSILPQEYCEEMRDGIARLPVGTGPFKLVRNDESMLVLTAFEPYFRERAFLDRLELWIVPEWDEQEETTAPSRYEMHYLSRAESGANENASVPAWKVTAKKEWGVQLLTFHLGKPGPQAHRSFREAMQLILDRQRMINELGGTRQEPALGLLPASVGKSGESTAREEDESEENTRASSTSEASQKAHLLQLLTDSQYNGETLHLYSFNDPDHVEDATWIREQCATFGIVIELHFCTVQELLQHELIQKADLILDGATVDEHIELSLLDLYLTENSFIKNHLNTELAAFVQSQITTLRQYPTLQVRLEIWLAIEQHLLEHRAFLGLYRNEARLLSHPELQGVQLNAQGWIDFRQLWFKKRDILNG